MQKFPWLQYGSSLLFYLVIAGGIFILATIIPQTNPEPITADQARALQQEQQIEQTKQIYQRVLTAVGKLMILPNTLPEISVVQDANAFLKQNPMFAGTSTGDIVLIYTDRVIIYSPQYNRIVHSQNINVSPQNLPGTSSRLENTTQGTDESATSQN